MTIIDHGTLFDGTSIIGAHVWSIFSDCELFLWKRPVFFSFVRNVL